MDRSYRLKMEEKLNNNILTQEYVINCVAKVDEPISKLAYKAKQYKHGYDCSDNYNIKLDEKIAYRKPFIEFLMNDCYMSLGEIKEAVADTKDKNYPTKKVCDQIRDMILGGNYSIG